MLLGLVGDAFKGGFYWIMLILDGYVYSIMTKIYKVYVILAGCRILTNDAFTTIANQLYVIIGVAMLFVLAYSIIRAIIDPDQLTKGKLSGPNLVKGVVFCVIGLAITPVIFNICYQAQDIILKQNVIGKMFFASDINDHYKYQLEGQDGKVEEKEIHAEDAMDSAGNVVAIYVWQTFFYPSEINAVSEDSIKGKRAEYIMAPGVTAALAIGCGIGIVAGIAASIFTLGFGALAVVATVAACVGAGVGAADKAVSDAVAEEMTLAEAIATATGNGDFGIFTIFTENVVAGQITYFFGVSTIVGLFVCYTFLSFSIDMAVRAAKLAYYQIIAPIPLILQILPNFKENFNKWLKDIIHTFLEVLIRLSIIYVVVYIISHLNVLTTSSAQLWGNENVSMSMGFVARLLLILGLIIFAKMAPKLISETFKINSGDMKLGIGKKLAEGGAFTAAATLGAAATSAVRNFNAEHKKPLPDGKGNKLSARFARNVRGVTSGLVGGLSAGTRIMGGSVMAAASGNGKKGPKNLREMRDAARATSERVTERKRERDQYAQEHRPDENHRGGVLAGRIGDARDAVIAWASGPVDTSYSDGQAKLLSDLAGLKSLLEGKINPEDEKVKAAADKVARLQNESLQDNAYGRELAKRTEVALDAGLADLYSKGATEQAMMHSMLTRAVGESQADYLTRVAEHMKKDDSELTAAERTSRDKFRADASKISGAVFDRDSARRHVQDSGFTKDRFTLMVGTPEYEEALAILNAERHKADDELKAAKKDAVARELAKSSTGTETDISRALGDFFTSHQREIRTYGRAGFDDKHTIAEFLQSEYGLDPTNGRISISSVLHSIADTSGSTGFEIKVDGKGTNLRKIEVRAHKDGDHEFVLLDAGGHAIKTFSSQAELESELRSNYRNVEYKDVESVRYELYNAATGALLDTFSSQEELDAAKSSTRFGGITLRESRVVGKSEGPTSATKSQVEQSRDRLVNSTQYIDEHRRQQQQREKQGK